MTYAMPYSSSLEADEADEMFEADEADEADEAARRTWKRPKVASGQGLSRPRTEGGTFATKAYVDSALARTAAQIRTNSSAINQLGGRVAAAAATVKKEASDRKKDLSGVRSSLSQTQQISAILPLLSQPQSVSVNGLGADGIPDGTKVLVGGSNTLALLLPMMLMTGIGTGTTSDGNQAQSGGLFGGGDNNSMMMLAMILALGNR